ncbi:MAG: hypothetical protein Q9167_001163 [Letrouitia subvulpina]
MSDSGSGSEESDEVPKEESDEIPKEGSDEVPNEVSDDAKEISLEDLPKRRRTASGFEPLPGSHPSTQNLLNPGFVTGRGTELGNMEKSPFQGPIQGPIQGPFQRTALTRDPGLFRRAVIRNHEQNQNPPGSVLPQASSAVAAFFNDPCSPFYNPKYPAQVTIPYLGELATLTLEKLEDPRFVHTMSTRYDVQPMPQEPKYFELAEQYHDWQKRKCPVPLAPLERGNRPVPILRTVEGRWKCVSVALLPFES